MQKSRTIKNTFHKEERLCSRKQIEKLFEQGQHQMVYPIKVMFTELHYETDYPAQAMFVAPKRQFKKAHDRNLLKRRMREGYRQNKQVLYNLLNDKKKTMILAFIYVGKKQESYKSIEQALQKLFDKIKTTLL